MSFEPDLILKMLIFVFIAFFLFSCTYMALVERQVNRLN